MKLGREQMSLKADKLEVSSETSGDGLIQHVFDSPVLQAEFEALASNEDRLDFIRGIEELGQLKNESTLSNDEVIAALGLG